MNTLPIINPPRKDESTALDSAANLHLLRELNRLDTQITELKAYTCRNSDNLFDEVTKLETLLFNATGGGLMSRVEKMTFSLEELDKRSEEVTKSLKQMEDFRYTVSSLVMSLKEKQDDALSQKSKVWNFAGLVFVSLLTTLLTFGLSNLPSSHDRHENHSSKNTKHSYGFVVTRSILPV